MPPEPLIIARAPSELFLLGPDGRLARRRLDASDDPASALAELWTAEYPEDGTGIVLTVDAGPAALRRLCAAARRAGGRIVGAWRWEADAVSTLNDADLIVHLLSAAGAARATPSLLARKAWRLPAISATRHRRWAAVATAALILLGSAFWRLEINARLARRSAAAEAAHELQEAQAAAGLHRRETEERTRRELSELTPPSAALYETLLAVANAAGPSVVVDQISSQNLVVRVTYRRVAAAPGADIAVHFPSLVREALIAAGVDSHFETEAPLPASGTTAAAEPLGPTFGLRLTSLSPPATSDVAAVIARLPTNGDLSVLRSNWEKAWTLDETSEPTRCEGVSARRLRFSVRDRGRSAWSDLLALASAIEREAGATIDQFSAAADGSETGAFARVSLTATFLLRGS